MEKDIPQNPKTRQVVTAFLEWWKSGGRAKLDGEQIYLLSIFHDFVEAYNAEPPPLGVAVSEDINVKDKAN